MPVQHHWESKQLLHTSYIGKVTADELINAALEVSGDQRFDDLSYIIGDWSQSTVSTITMDDVERLAAYISAISKSNPSIKNVSVMNRNESSQSLISIYSMFTEQTSWEMEAFHSMVEAREWLGVK